MILKSISDVRRLLNRTMVEYDANPNQVARYAGCCRGTVVRLSKGLTKSPHMKTVLRILVTMGYRVEAVEKWQTMVPADERLPNL